MVVEIALRLLLLAAVVCSLWSRGAWGASSRRFRWGVAVVAIAAALGADPIGLGLARVDGLLLGSACAAAPWR
jgi:hypothetical protein